MLKIMISSDSKALASLTIAIFIAYLPVGLPLSVLPVYVRQELLLSDVMVGLVVGAQFVATVLTRGYTGRLADSCGGRRATLLGFGICVLAGLLLALALGLQGGPALFMLIISRVVLGLGQGLLVTANLAWGFGLVGASHSGRVMAWTGMALYGSLAAGVPLGVWLAEIWGQQAVGWASCLSPLVAGCINCWVKAVPKAQGPRLSMFKVVRLIWRHGLALALHGVGFAVISSFSALYFIAQGWANTGLALSCFGLAYAAVRVFGSHIPDRLGGGKVTLVSLACEIVGLILIWLAPCASLALAGFVVTGLGCSLVFPALGVEVLKVAPPHMRGTAIGAFSAFQDAAFGGAGPLAGLLVPWLGYGAVFGAAGLCALLGFALVWRHVKTTY